jgi:hypothetical protein
MKLRTLPDGSLVLEERLTLLRWGALVLALALVAVLGHGAWVRGRLLPREAVGGGLGVMALVGLSAAVADREFRFNRALGRMTWTVRHLTRTRIGEVRFHEIEGVVLRSEVDTDNPSRPLHYTPLLETRAGTIPLSSFNSRDRKHCEEVAHAVAVVLGRPTESVKALAVEDLVAAGRLVDAITLVRKERGLDLSAAKSYVDSLRRRKPAA